MPSLNKESVRDEISRIKGEFDKLQADGSVSKEVQALMNSVLLVLNLILTVFMEKNTKKNSSNSSIPPSQTDDDETSTSQPGSNKKGRIDDGSVASNTRHRESITVSEVSQCDVCGESLESVACSCIERRTKIDIYFEKVVQHVDAEVKDCPSCGATVKGCFPDDMHGPLQYGTGLKAFIINLLIGQMVALNRAQRMISAMVGCVISEATMLKYVLRLYQALEQWEHDSIEKLITGPVIHADETSFKVEKKRHWIHVYSSGGLTIKLLHKNRGLKAIKDLNIIPRYSGVVIHDCMAAYLSYTHFEHGLCGSHLLRELTFIVDSNQYNWAVSLKKLLKQTAKLVASRDEKCLSDSEYLNLRKRYRNILTRGDKELPPIPPKPKGKRGKMAKSDAHNLHERFRKHEKSVLLFAKNPDVAFTNNRAERDLRMAKVKQKVSGCFRSEQFAHAYCRISSYLQSMAIQGVNPLVAIEIALSGQLYNQQGGE